jgi:hypothetical protein
MTVAQYTRPDYTTQSAAAYKANIDGMAAVFERFGNNFAPYANSPAAMNVKVAAGVLFVSGAIVSQAIQTTGTITAPVGNPRIDRIVVDAITGAVSVITGTPAGSPTAPAITAGKLPVAQVLLQTSSTTITNSMITDERIGTGASSGSSTKKTRWNHHFNGDATDIVTGVVGYITSNGLLLATAGTLAHNAANHSLTGTGTGSVRPDIGIYNRVSAVNAYSTAWKASADPMLIMRCCPTGSSASDRFAGLAGAQIAGAAPTNGIYWRFNTSGNYIGVCRASGTESTVDSGIAATAGTQRVLKAVVSAGGTSVQFFVDDAAVGSPVSTNIPSAALGFSMSGPVTGSVGYIVTDIDIEQDME